ncbi:DNA methylase [Bacteroides sp. 4_1_36]|uniref:DNA-methyltransferase n=1 Tax=Bacteroides sp. 4_1_36 TaxID=457393 RepID=UPI0001EFFC48|nr:site-specific DNA-methyltransferase [Bacteroides sp. 4_1_36]EFV24481.1 DNA methylase [Bacteroides sp. 4_1_36]
MNQIYNSECLLGLKSIPSNSIHCCVTSPPYYNLRDYGHEDQIGLEKTPEEYIQKLVDVFREVKRVMKDDGTLWINIGDSYNGSGKAGNNPNYWSKHTAFGKLANKSTFGYPVKVTSCKPKDLIGIPWMLAFALRADGWYLRQDIIWSKPSVMPESVKDRCTKSHEYIFLLSKNKTYYFDSNAIAEPATSFDTIIRDRDITKLNNAPRRSKMKGLIHNDYLTRNKRSVWTVATQPLREAHFATYPEKLIVDCIKAGCPESGIVLDPFMGSGTTAVVARKLDRNYIGFELNPDYVCLAKKRISEELGIFK